MEATRAIARGAVRERTRFSHFPRAAAPIITYTRLSAMMPRPLEGADDDGYRDFRQRGEMPVALVSRRGVARFFAMEKLDYLAALFA